MLTGNMLFCSTLVVLFLSLDYVQPKHVRSSHDWDVLIFTQNWPLTICEEWKQRDPSHTCAMPQKHDSFSIHGIWPTKLGTIGPQFCNRSWHFDPEQIRPIETKLTQYWTNIDVETSTYALWTHEWTKHGTCAAILEPLNSELKYFSKGIEWLEKYTMTNIFAESDILPSNTKQYSVETLSKAVSSKLGVNAMITCKKINGQNHLQDVRMCFDKSLKPVDCNGIVSIWSYNFLSSVLTNCGHTQDVIYPEKLIERPHKWFNIVDMYKLFSWLHWFTL